MKLYFSPGSCSLAVHIVLHESGLPFETVQTSTKTHLLPDGSDYYAISPNGYVPLLELDNGERLTEGPAINQYLADLVPTLHLAPANGTMARYRLQEALNFIGTELHKTIGGLFNPAMPDEAKALFRAKGLARLTWINSQLEAKPYLVGETFTIADAYLFVVCSWTPRIGIDRSELTALTAFMNRVSARPAVQAAMKAEGLLT